MRVKGPTNQPNLLVDHIQPTVVPPVPTMPRSPPPPYSSLLILEVPKNSSRMSPSRTPPNQENAAESSNCDCNTVVPKDNEMGNHSPTTACQTSLSQKSPSKNERKSPEPNCSICLGKLEDKSYTNSCRHIFCFTCLLQWSKIKAECPLCKQTFKSIIHNVRSNGSMQEYDEHQIQPAQALPFQDNHLAYQTFHNYPSTIEVRAMAQRVPFRYSTTVTGERRFQARIFTTVDSGWVLPSEMPMPGRLHRLQRRVLATNQFRASVYEMDLWANPPNDISGRYRDCSPTFFRLNPAQIHRLVPWLHRELDIVCHNRGIASVVLDLVVNSVTRHEINSLEMRRLLQPHLRERTDHFIHEFYSFASSHFDLISYDTSVTYGPSPVPNVAIQVVSDDSSDDSDVLILPQETPVAGPSGVTRRRGNLHSMPPPQSQDNDNDSDECQFVQYIKPRHERTPEIIDLSSEDDRTQEGSLPIDIGSMSPMDDVQMNELLDYKLEDLDSARMMLESLDSISSEASGNSSSSEYLPSKSLYKSRRQEVEAKTVSKKKPAPKSSDKGKRRCKSSKKPASDSVGGDETKRKRTSKRKTCDERGKKTSSHKKRSTKHMRPLNHSSDDDTPLSQRHVQNYGFVAERLTSSDDRSDSTLVAATSRKGKSRSTSSSHRPSGRETRQLQRRTRSSSDDAGPSSYRPVPSSTVVREKKQQPHKETIYSSDDGVSSYRPSPWPSSSGRMWSTDNYTTSARSTLGLPPFESNPAQDFPSTTPLQTSGRSTRRPSFHSDFNYVDPPMGHQSRTSTLEAAPPPRQWSTTQTSSLNDTVNSSPMHNYLDSSSVNPLSSAPPDNSWNFPHVSINISVDSQALMPSTSGASRDYDFSVASDRYYGTAESVPSKTVPSVVRSVVNAPVLRTGKDMPKLWSRLAVQESSNEDEEGSDRGETEMWSIRNKKGVKYSETTSDSSEDDGDRPKLKSIVITRRPSNKHKEKRDWDWKRKTVVESSDEEATGPSK